jgi:hypothetical protein
LKRYSPAGCAWIVDQLIGIRELEQELVAAFASGDMRRSMLLRFRVAELSHSVEELDRALDAYGPGLCVHKPVGFAAAAHG